MLTESDIESIVCAESPIIRPRGARRLGASREGRDLWGYGHGEGTIKVSLIAGCHADEPVGPALLERLAVWLESAPNTILERFRFTLVPHANPDGEKRNSWTEKTVEVRDHLGQVDSGYSLTSYLREVVRELPGDDVEFGFPRFAEDEVRPENAAMAAFLREEGPFHLHISFHGMGFAPGPWFLQEAYWIDRARPLRENLTRRVSEMGYRLYDVDRGGAKGFWRIAPGFTTRPDSRAMRDFFLARGQVEEAAKFRRSSMEWVRAEGSDPLTMVSEMPLFLLEGRDRPPDRERLFRDLNRQLASGRNAESMGIRPMPIRDQMRLQMALLKEGLATIERMI